MGEIEPTLVSQNGKPVKFPFNRQPCFKPGEKYLIHFISSSDTWYAYIFQGSGDPFCKLIEDNYSNAQLMTLQYYYGLTGACCAGNNSCEITEERNCSGFFVGVGSTCGNLNTQICSEKVGSCCVKNTTDGKESVYCLDNISVYNCMSLQTSGVETVFSGINKTCSEMNCVNSFEQVGACCDGKGGCEQVSKNSCISTGRSFLGHGILCNSFENDLCSSGTGACCFVSGTCSSVSSKYCFDNLGFYHGSDTTCEGVTCMSNLGCCNFLEYKLKPGDLFGGGVVVGVYDPNKSRLFGASNNFSKRGTTAEFLYGGETFAGYYKSEYDFSGYGITGNDCNAIISGNYKDSYYIIVSLYPATIDKDGVGVNPNDQFGVSDTFSWYGNGLAWGPLLNLDTYTQDDLNYFDKIYETEYLKYGEGFYGITAENFENIKNVTFQQCRSCRVNGFSPTGIAFTRNIKNSNGLWNRNWGLYNTIRMLSADNANYLGLTGEYYTSSSFDSGDKYNSLYALKLFDNSSYDNSYGLTANNLAISDWYIPSHDELAFLAANCITDTTNSYYGFNLNSELLLNNGTPLYGWHWSSTGSFDENNKNEGIYVNGKPKHGSKAWSIYFDENGDSTQFKVKKENRSEKLKVRPIRMIRCDGQYPDENSVEYKLWKTQNLLRKIK